MKENLSENYNTNFENKTNQNIKDSLILELNNMEQRSPDRTDIKYLILKKFIKLLETKKFNEAFSKLNEIEQHAIITRLQNQTSHMGGLISYDFVKKLEQTVYGVIVDDDNEKRINSSKQVDLEKRLQEENFKQ